jgi:hypothetical protein
MFYTIKEKDSEKEFFSPLVVCSFWHWTPYIAEQQEFFAYLSGWQMAWHRSEETATIRKMQRLNRVF